MTKQAWMIRYVGDVAWITTGEFSRITVAAKATGEAMKEFAGVLWACEQRRRIWFWRGLIGDNRSATFRVCVRSAHWWWVGRRGGEILAGLIR